MNKPTGKLKFAGETMTTMRGIIEDLKKQNKELKKQVEIHKAEVKHRDSLLEDAWGVITEAGYEGCDNGLRNALEELWSYDA
jgi:hypothetical protein